MNCPRRSRGAAASSQASAPAHVKPLPQPWAKRAAASGQKPWTNAKARLESPISVRPIRTARRAPIRAVAQPPNLQLREPRRIGEPLDGLVGSLQHQEVAGSLLPLPEGRDRHPGDPAALLRLKGHFQRAALPLSLQQHAPAGGGSG